MKRIIVAFLLILNIGIAYGASDKTITSKTYVDNQLATKQDKIPAVDTKTVITHTGTSGDIGQKAIYDSNENYVSQQTALMTAGDANTGINNALENEFVCVDEDTDSTCLLWSVKNTSPQQILPDGYTALEYLEGTGTQWICTDIAINKTDNARLEMDASFTPKHGWIGANGFLQLNLGLDYYTVHTAGSAPPLKMVNIGNRDKIVLTYDSSGVETLYVNGNKIDTVNWTFWNTNTVYLGIFTLTHSYCQKYAGISWAKIYSLNLVLNNSVTHKIIPARRDSDGELGMYDLVSNTFFTNQGSGTFTAGPDLDVYIPSGN